MKLLLTFILSWGCGTESLSKKEIAERWCSKFIYCEIINTSLIDTCVNNFWSFNQGGIIDYYVAQCDSTKASCQETKKVFSNVIKARREKVCQ